MKRVIIVNECFSDNIGDQAIALAMNKFCQGVNGEAIDTADFSFRPKKYQFHNHLRGTKQSRNSLLDIMKKCVPKGFRKLALLPRFLFSAHSVAKQKYKIAVIGGGQLILSNSNFGASMFAYTVMFRLYNTKIRILAVGAGKNFCVVDKFLFGIALNLAEDICVRDSQSQANILHNFGLEVGICPDIVYYLTPLSPSRTIKRSILVCPIDYSVYRRYHKEVKKPSISLLEYKQSWVELIVQLDYSYNPDFIYISATTTADYCFSKSLEDLFELELFRKLVFVKASNVDEFFDLSSRCKAIVAGRMHALIFGHLLNLEVIPYVVSEKISSFSDQYIRYHPKHFRDKLNSIQLTIL